MSFYHVFLGYFQGCSPRDLGLGLDYISGYCLCKFLSIYVFIQCSTSKFPSLLMLNLFATSQATILNHQADWF